MDKLTQEQKPTQAQLSRERLAALQTTLFSMGIVDAAKFESFLIGALAFEVSKEAWDAAFTNAVKRMATSRKFELDDAREMGGYDPEAREWTRTLNDFPVAKPTHEEEVPF